LPSGAAPAHTPRPRGRAPIRPLAVLSVTGLLVFGGLVAAPSPARALAPAIFHPAPAWLIGITTKITVRVLEFVDWALEDLRNQVDRRRGWNPPSPILPSPLASVASGGTSTAAAGAPVAARRSAGGMLP
jgi:hypothetical protein